jgi:hypothetical protein
MLVYGENVNAFEMKWYKAQITEIDGKVIYIAPVKECNAYNPFNYYIKASSSIYHEFASINENNIREISAFIEKYGVLGLESEKDIYKKENQFKILLKSDYDFLESIIEQDKGKIAQQISSLSEQVRLFKETDENSEINKRFESIDEIKNEIRTMRLLLDLKCNIKKIVNPEDVDEYAQKIYELDSNITFDETFIIQTEANKLNFVNKNLAKEANAHLLIAATIKGKMKNASFDLNVNYDYEKKQFETVMTWHPKNLITAMYTMLYMDIVGQKIISRCQNPSCNRFYTMQTLKQDKYCSNECASAVSSQRLRNTKNNAYSLYKEGKSIEEIAVVLGRTPNQIKKWIESK